MQTDGDLGEGGFANRLAVLIENAGTVCAPDAQSPFAHVGKDGVAHRALEETAQARIGLLEQLYRLIGVLDVPRVGGRDGP